METKDALNFVFVAVVLVVMVALVACNTTSSDAPTDNTDGDSSELALAGAAITWISCSDTDGDSPNTAGSVTYTYLGNDGVSRTRTNNDVCGGSQVREYKCTGNVQSSYLVYCSDGCSAGACISSPPPSSTAITLVEATPDDLTAGATALTICTNNGFTGCVAGGRNATLRSFKMDNPTCVDRFIVPEGVVYRHIGGLIHDYRLVGCDIVPTSECYLNSTGTGYANASNLIVSALCTG